MNFERQVRSLQYLCVPVLFFLLLVFFPSSLNAQEVWCPEEQMRALENLKIILCRVNILIAGFILLLIGKLKICIT